MKNVLEFDSLYLSFDNRPILSSIYMRCLQGEVVGLLGRNGAGKSCLMKIVFDILPADHKSVRINGISLQGDYNKKKVIAYLPQDKLIPSYVTLRTAFELFETDINKYLPFIPQIKDLVDFKPDELSGGSLRLIEALLILFSSSRFCILDEPFTGLMPAHIDTLKHVIAETKEKKGIIISDHLHRHVTALSDRLYLLTNGKTHEIKEKERLVELGYLRSL